MIKFVTKCAIFSFAISCISFSQDSLIGNQSNLNQPQLSQKEVFAQSQIPEDQEAMIKGLYHLKTQWELIKDNHFCFEDRWEKIGKSILKIGTMALPLTLAIKLIDKIIPDQNSKIGKIASFVLSTKDPVSHLSSFLLNNFIVSHPEFYSTIALTLGHCRNIKNTSILKYIASSVFGSVVLPYFNARWAGPGLEKLSSKCSFVHDGIEWLADKAVNSFGLQDRFAWLYHRAFDCNVQVINGLHIQATEKLKNLYDEKKANKKITNFAQESFNIIQKQTADISFNAKCLIALNTLENFGFVGYSIISWLTPLFSSSDEPDQIAKEPAVSVPDPVSALKNAF